MQKPLNRDAIKLAAMATMACNHFAQALLPGGERGVRGFGGRQ